MRNSALSSAYQLGTHLAHNWARKMAQNLEGAKAARRAELKAITMVPAMEEEMDDLRATQMG